MKQLLELLQHGGEGDADALAPTDDAAIRMGQHAHEDVGAAHAIPAGFAGESQGLLETAAGGFRKEFASKTPAGEEDIVHGFAGGGHSTESIDSSNLG